MSENELSKQIIYSAIEVHRQLGPGLLERVYEKCLAYELKRQGLITERQVPVDVFYKGNNMGMGYRLDILVEKKVVIEVKCVGFIENIHLAQTMTYLKITNKKLALILNFNAELMKYGIQRVVNGL